MLAVGLVDYFVVVEVDTDSRPVIPLFGHQHDVPSEDWVYYLELKYAPRLTRYCERVTFIYAIELHAIHAVFDYELCKPFVFRTDLNEESSDPHHSELAAITDVLAEGAIACQTISVSRKSGCDSKCEFVLCERP